MSYILDALNKSEQERREQDNVPSLQAIHDDKSNAHPQSHNFPWVPIAVGLVLLGLLLAIVMLSILRNNDATPQHSPAPISSIGQAEPVQATLVNARPTSVQHSNGSREKLIFSNAQSASALSVNAEVDALYAQESDTHARALTAVPPQASTGIIGNSVDTELADAVVADYQAFDGAASFVPNVQQLPKSLQSRVPALDYSAHIYSSDERSGFAIINGKSRYKGDILSRDLFVEAIEEDGLVLNVQGISFKVPAMKSWQPPR